ncbi:UTP--glucose-1-phosphate uridylyltransferase, partial [Parageobacillus sp. SY1]
IFGFLEKQEAGAGGEIQLTDAIQKLNETQSVYAYSFSGKRYDVGEKLGFVKTTIEFALQNEELREELAAFLKEIVKTLP